ncbi:hypothetical protein VNI00_009618 [Paramarasmius palmivorus]|uniref:chitin deacetylase n=1 Tax=Paramarasmius palmivorus TaxID=297713 RepID=A0AAW0CQG1_9AGAR
MIVPHSFAAVALVSLLNFVSAADRTVAEQSAIADPAKQCEAYYYAPVAEQLPNFPKTWTTATIPASDTTARTKFNSISNSIPKIQPKGPEIMVTVQSYDKVNDPDCWWTAGGCTKPKLAGIPEDISLIPEPRTLGYGFDDGPNCSHNAFYDYLTSHNQKATMFFIGSNVLGWPLQAKRAFEDGHEICTVGLIKLVRVRSSKPLLRRLISFLVTAFTDEEAWAELYYIIGFKPPLGDIDDRIRYIAHSLGLTTMLWKYDTYDSHPGPSGLVEVDTVEKHYKEFIDTAKSGAFNHEGAILLMHESSNLTMSQAVKWYPDLKDAFEHIVPVGVAMNNTQIYVESSITSPTFQQYVSARGSTVEEEESNGALSLSASLSTLAMIMSAILYCTSATF